MFLTHSDTKKESKSEVQATKSGKLDKHSKGDSKGAVKGKAEEEKKAPTTKKDKKEEGNEIVAHFKQAITESEKRGPGEYGDASPASAGEGANPTAQMPATTEAQKDSAQANESAKKEQPNQTMPAVPSIPEITTTSAVDSSIPSPRAEPGTVAQGDSVTIFHKAVQHKAIYAYLPSKISCRCYSFLADRFLFVDAPDELELVLGQIVSVTALFDDGWMKGFNDKNIEGVFPGNYVEIVKVAPKVS